MTEIKQHILLSVGIEYSSDSNNDVDLEKRTKQIERFVFEALEHMRQESKLSPNDLSANFVTVDTDRIDEAYGDNNE
jgi:hypothetical protein